MLKKASRHLFLAIALLILSALFNPVRAIACENINPNARAIEKQSVAVAAKLFDTTVSITGGSGVVIDEDGTILTAAHVSQKPGREINVTFANGEQYRAMTLGVNHATDVGMIKILSESRSHEITGELKKFPFAKFSKAKSFPPTTRCIAAGYPISYEAGESPAIRIGCLIQQESQRLLTNCKIMGGDSGGPLVDMQGDLIGITSRVLADGNLTIHAPAGAILRDANRLLNGEIINESAISEPVDEAAIQTVVQQEQQLRSNFFGETDSYSYASSFVRIMSGADQVALGTPVGKNLIITKASELGDDFEIETVDGERSAGTIVAIDDQYDIALIRTQYADLTPVVISKQLFAIPVGTLLYSPMPSHPFDAAIGITTSTPRVFSISESDYAANNERGFLGVMVSDTSDDGLEIIRIVPDSVAKKSGLQIGERIISVDDVKPNSSQQLALLLNQKNALQKVEFAIAGEESNKRTITITLGKLPKRFHGLQFDRWGGGPFSDRRFGFPLVLPHDSTIAPNECGGPIFDTSGNFVGVNIARALTAHTLAVPSQSLTALLANFQQNTFPKSPNTFSEIDAAGIPGVLMLNGSGKIDDETIDAFVKFGPGAWKRGANEDGNRDRRLNTKCDCCVLTFSSKQETTDEETTDKDDAQSIAARIADIDVEFDIKVTPITIENTENEKARQTSIDEIISQLETATHVWIEGDDRPLMQSVLAEPKLLATLRKILRNSGTIGGDTSFSSLAGGFAKPSGQKDAKKLLVPGLNFVPQAIVVADPDSADEGKDRARKLLKGDDPFFAIRLTRSSTLVVSGRSLIRFTGEQRRVLSGARAVRIQFAKSDNWNGETLSLIRSRYLADLTSIRRFALRRMGPTFPTTEIIEPVVSKGTLMIVGGGGTPKGLLGEFVELAGGDDAKIVVVPISMPPPLPLRERMSVSLRKLGAKKVTVLRGRTPKDITDADTLSALREATGIWFGGGRQWRFVDAYEDTQSLKLMHDVLKRGGVIAGSSAGASIQGDFLNRGNPLGSQYPSADGYEKGFAFLPGTAIDQHFAQRKRFADLGSLIEQHPQLLGIGVDESTALVVNKDGASVVGKNSVWLYDRRVQFREKELEDSRYSKENYAEFKEGDEIELLSRQLKTVPQ